MPALDWPGLFTHKKERLPLHSIILICISLFSRFVDFNKNYNTDACHGVNYSNSTNQNASLPTNSSLTTVSAMTTVGMTTTVSMVNATNSSVVGVSAGGGVAECLRENSILFLLLMLGTVWLGITLFNFTKTYDLNTALLTTDELIY